MATRDRKNLNIKRRREALREELKSREYLRQLHNIADEAKKADKEEIPALRLRADICFGLLKKTLPDLKSTEMTVRDEREPTRDELIRRAEQVGMSAADLFGDEPKH